jgi:hypothetical protein
MLFDAAGAKSLTETTLMDLVPLGASQWNPNDLIVTLSRRKRVFEKG